MTATLKEELRQAARAGREALSNRDALIHQAIAEGWTHSQIADATGLSRGRIGQIATQKRI